MYLLPQIKTVTMLLSHYMYETLRGRLSSTLDWQILVFVSKPHKDSNKCRKNTENLNKTKITFFGEKKTI